MTDYSKVKYLPNGNYICPLCAEELYLGETVYIDDNYEFAGCQFCIHDFLYDWKRQHEKTIEEYQC